MARSSFIRHLWCLLRGYHRVEVTDYVWVCQECGDGGLC